MKNEYIKSFCIYRNIEFREGFEISKFSQIKAGGKVDILILPENKVQILELVEFFKSNETDYRVIGNLSNTLFRSGEIKTPFVSLKKLNEISCYGDKIEVQAGCLLTVLVRYLNKSNITSLDGLIGVPAQLGGAIFMNASCYGSCISDDLLSVECVDNNGNLVSLNKSELDFSWRSSIFQKEFSSFVIIKANFVFKRGGIPSTKDNNEAHRKLYQEKHLPNLGSLYSTRDIYADISKTDVFFKYIIFFSRVLAKILPGNVHLNAQSIFVYLSRKYFSLQGDRRVGVSDQTINCLVNRSNATGDELIDFVRDYQRKINNVVDLEIIVEDKIE